MPLSQATQRNDSIDLTGRKEVGGRRRGAGMDEKGRVEWDKDHHDGTVKEEDSEDGAHGDLFDASSLGSEREVGEDGGVGNMAGAARKGFLDKAFGRQVMEEPNPSSPTPYPRPSLRPAKDKRSKTPQNDRATTLLPNPFRISTFLGILPLLSYILPILVIACLFLALISPFNNALDFLSSGIRSLGVFGAKTISFPVLALSYLSSAANSLRETNAQTLTAVWCGSVGIGCDPEPIVEVAKVARTMSEQATQAHDIFQSVVALGDPAGMGLHHTEIWELGIAVRATSDLPDREYLGTTLKQLGDMTRDLKDKMTSLNSRGINSFAWIVQEFSRIEQFISRPELGPGIASRNLLSITSTRSVANVRAKTLNTLVETLFERLSVSLSTLINSVESAIPLASLASDLGGDILEQFEREKARLVMEREKTPLWKHLLDAVGADGVGTFRSRQLKRDLGLTEVTIGNLKAIRRNLEEARAFLRGYSDNIAYYKTGITAFHLSSDQLEPEHEVEALKLIMGDFRSALAEAKDAHTRPRSVDFELSGSAPQPRIAG